MISEALKRATISPQDVDQVIMGQVFDLLFLLLLLYRVLDSHSGSRTEPCATGLSGGSNSILRSCLHCKYVMWIWFKVRFFFINTNSTKSLVGQYVWPIKLFVTRTTILLLLGDKKTCLGHNMPPIFAEVN